MTNTTQAIAKSQAQLLVAELNGTAGRSIAHLEHLNAALLLAVDATDNRFEQYQPHVVPTVRLEALLAAHAAVNLAASRAFYVADTVAMLAVAEVLARLINTQVRLATNPVGVLVRRFLTQRDALLDEVNKAGAVVCHEFAANEARIRRAEAVR